MFTELINYIGGKIAAAFSWIGDLFVSVFVAIWDLLKDLMCWIFESFLKLIMVIFNSLSFDFEIFNPAKYFDSLPADMVNMIGFLRVGEAFAIILAAIIIKLTLQIIPFTRLGS